jgi:hypothetical protein
MYFTTSTQPSRFGRQRSTLKNIRSSSGSEERTYSVTVHSFHYNFQTKIKTSLLFSRATARRFIQRNSVGRKRSSSRSRNMSSTLGPPKNRVSDVGQRTNWVLRSSDFYDDSWVQITPVDIFCVLARIHLMQCVGSKHSIQSEMTWCLQSEITHFHAFKLKYNQQ